MHSVPGREHHGIEGCRHGWKKTKKQKKTQQKRCLEDKIGHSCSFIESLSMFVGEHCDIAEVDHEGQ